MSLIVFRSILPVCVKHFVHWTQIITLTLHNWILRMPTSYLLTKKPGNFDKLENMEYFLSRANLTKQQGNLKKALLVARGYVSVTTTNSCQHVLSSAASYHCHQPFCQIDTSILGHISFSNALQLDVFTDRVGVFDITFVWYFFC